MAVHTYYCSACGAQARKEAVKVAKEHAATLGTWHCTKPCTTAKVKVTKQKVAA